METEKFLFQENNFKAVRKDKTLKTNQDKKMYESRVGVFCRTSLTLDFNPIKLHLHPR